MRGRIVFLTIHRRHVLFVLFVLAMTIVYGIWTRQARGVGVPAAELRVGGRIVAIDAGHGGPDPGAIGVSGVVEKDVTLAIALELEKRLREAGFRTVLTRTGDYDLVRGEAVSHRQREDLIRRAALVNGSGASVFVSLHANSFPEPAWFGAQTFYEENDEGGFGLATYIQAALVRELTDLGPNHRRATTADLRILRDVKVPAVVVEVGFLSNPAEEALLRRADYQARVARAIADGIMAYFAAVDRHGSLREPASLEL